MLNLLAGLVLPLQATPHETLPLVDAIAEKNGKTLVAVMRDDFPTIGALLKTDIGNGEAVRGPLLKKGWDLRVGDEVIAVFPTAYRPENFPSIEATSTVASKYGCRKPDRREFTIEGESLVISKSMVLLAADLPALLKKPKMQVNWFAGRTPIVVSSGTTPIVDVLRMAAIATATQPIKRANGEHALVADGAEFSSRYRRHLELRKTGDAAARPNQTWVAERREVVLAAWDTISVERKKAWMDTEPSKTRKAEILKVKSTANPRLSDLFRRFYKKVEDVVDEKQGEDRRFWNGVLALRDETRESLVWFRIMSGQEEVLMPSTQQANSWTGI